MEYINTLKHTVYFRNDGQTLSVGPGVEITLSETINIPGLIPVIPRKPRTKSVSPKKKEVSLDGSGTEN